MRKHNRRELLGLITAGLAFACGFPTLSRIAWFSQYNFPNPNVSDGFESGAQCLSNWSIKGRDHLLAQDEYRDLRGLMNWEFGTGIFKLSNDIAEIISGPFKREKAKIIRVDKLKEEVVVELLQAAVPIPITVKMDAVKVIRRDTAGGEGSIKESDDEEIETPSGGPLGPLGP